MEDWRLQGQENYLCGVSLMKEIWRMRSQDSDHDHCEFCWAKFSERDEDLHQGYTTDDRRYWICENCYNDFKGEFHWQEPGNGCNGK